MHSRLKPPARAAPHNACHRRRSAVVTGTPSLKTAPRTVETSERGPRERRAHLYPRDDAAAALDKVAGELGHGLGAGVFQQAGNIVLELHRVVHRAEVPWEEEGWGEVGRGENEGDLRGNEC